MPFELPELGAEQTRGEVRMPANWFEDLFGFRERSYDETKNNLEMMGATLRSRVNQRSYVIGELTTPSLRELREEAVPLVEGRRGMLKVF